MDLQPAQLLPCLLLGRILKVQATLCTRPARGDSKGGVDPCGGGDYDDVGTVHGTVFRPKCGVSLPEPDGPIPTAGRLPVSTPPGLELHSTTDQHTGVFCVFNLRVWLKPQRSLDQHKVSRPLKSPEAARFTILPNETLDDK